MQQLLQNPAVIGGLAGALVVALTNLTRGLYTLYMTRSRRTLEPALSLTISGRIEPRDGSEDVVDCRLLVENVGDVRVVLRSAVLKVRPPLVEDEATGSWIRRLRWAEAEIFDAFDPQEVPGKVLNPRERYEEPSVLFLATGSA